MLSFHIKSIESRTLIIEILAVDSGCGLWTVESGFLRVVVSESWDDVCGTIARVLTMMAVPMSVLALMSNVDVNVNVYANCQR